MKHHWYTKLSLLVVLNISVLAGAQEIPPPPLVFSAAMSDLSAKADSFSKMEKYTMTVRPNAGEQALYVMVMNTSNSTRSFFLTASLNKKIIASAAVKDLPSQQVELVHLKSPGETPKTNESKTDEPKTTGAGRVISPEDTIVFKAYSSEADSNKANATPVTFEVKGDVRSADSFLEVKTEVGNNDESFLGKLKVIIKHRKKDNLGQPCKVALDLSNLTGLSPESLKDDATLVAELDADIDQVVLSVNKARLAPGVAKLGENGFFSITVDGCRRAFMFKTELKPGTQPQRVPDNNVVRVAIDRGPNSVGSAANRVVYIKPNKDQKIVARLEVDNATSDMRLEYGIYGDERPDPNVYQKKLFSSTRNQNLTFQPGKQDSDGTLRFAATVQDHEMSLNTVEGTTGKRIIKLSLLNKDNSSVSTFELPVIFDPNPPTITRFDASPANPKKGSKVKLSVEATSLSSIESAYFFLGESPPPAAMNKLVPGKLVAGHYEAEMQLPADLKGPAQLGVRVFSGNGEKMEKSTEINVTEPPPPEARFGKVRVTVLQYVDDVPQPKLPVVLRNAKNEVVQTGETDKNGQVLFEKVQPGKYDVASAKAFDKSAGVTKIEVKPDEEVKESIRLKRVR